jgi:FtsH-binding integral membrane protein
MQTDHIQDAFHRAAVRPRAQTESQIAAFMGTVYLWMSLGVACSAGVAYGVGTHPEAMQALMGTWVVVPVLLAPFFLVFLLGTRARQMSSVAVGFWYLVMTSIMGVWLSGIAARASEDPKFAELVGMSLFTTSAMFGGMAIIGWTIRRDLQGLGTFFLSALLGLIVAGVANLFFHNSTFEFLISLCGVLVFSALIAFDVQKAKLNADQGFGGAILSALDLYLDIINLFLYLLKLFGGSNSSND